MQTRLFVDGRFVDALDGRTIPVFNPHDGSLLAEVAQAGERAVDAARGGQHTRVDRRGHR